ncbi:unnamed protein product [Paramecium pentaurelia]|uniref:Methyltransferase domain-containing protein n=1 Tax=Paramecium pentaurelia TaxID=43138 RepID=A0A8S1X840_9CILI|nr:unnamed protein product [Paramecium pentaurelia]
MINRFFRLYFCSSIKIEPVNIHYQDGLFDTTYGLLKMTRNPYLNQKQLESITNSYFLVDGVGSNFIKSLFKKDMNSLIIFDCEKMHLRNAIEIYQATKKQIDLQFFGTPKRPRNPFSKCKGPKDIFNLYRHIQNQQKLMLSRMCLIVSYNGEVRIQGTLPECGDLKYHLEEQPENISQIGYRKYNYLLPFSAYQGIVTAYNYEKEGLAIEFLNYKKIYALYGVFPPTQRQYQVLFHSYMQKLVKIHDVTHSSLYNVIDLGCGTGVLGFIANDVLLRSFKDKEINIYSLDNVENAVKSAKINSQCLEYKNYTAELGDITDIDTLQYQLTVFKYPAKFNLIIANPPWIQASKIRIDDSIENTVTDPDGIMLKSIFEFANKYLQIESLDSTKGRLILIYSDLSQLLELQEKEKVQDLCREYKMGITYYSELPFHIKDPQNVDPLLQYKQNSKVQLFEIRKI